MGIPLQIMNSMFHQLVDCLDEGIHIVDSNGMTLFYNQSASLLDGLPVDEVVGYHVLDMFPSLTLKTSTLLKVLETGKPEGEQQQTFTNRKGKRIITINRTFPLLFKNKVIGAIEISRDITQMKKLSDQVIDLQERIHETYPLNKRKKKQYQFSDIITQNPALIYQVERAKKASQTHSPVLVIGETGTGKELVVQSIHSSSKRKNGPFVAQNCAAIPSSLLEGILFGTVKGAFTGSGDRPGLFELASGGTLFLDEIQSMPMDLQAKLLRVLEEEEVRRVGGSQVKPVDVRIIVATNEDPQISIHESRLRQDLFYRINVVRIELPPLRERVEDIALLTKYFIQKICVSMSAPIQEISGEILESFKKYPWPGNVRELENTLEGALNMSMGEILGSEHFPFYIMNRRGDKTQSVCFLYQEGQSLKDWMEQIERQVLQQTLNKASGNVLQAAKQLGIPRQTLQYKIRKLKI